MNMTTCPEGRVVFLQMKLCRGKSEKRADRVVRPYKVQQKIEGCTVSVRYCLTAIIKIACGA